MVLPEGFALPPLPYGVALAIGTFVVGWALTRTRPAVSSHLIIAAVPWILVGSVLHVLYQLSLVPPTIVPLLGTPAVYVTTFILAGTALAGATRLGEPDQVFGGIGIIAFVLALLVFGTGAPRLRPKWLIIGLLLSLLVGGTAWSGFRRARPSQVMTAPHVGQLVVFAHTLDGISTAIGVDLLGFGERTPASRVILDLAGALPTAEVLGTGWLFVLVKVGVAIAVVWVFADYVQEDPVVGNLLLGVIIAVGLGPGVHNLLLYTVLP